MMLLLPEFCFEVLSLLSFIVIYFIIVIYVKLETISVNRILLLQIWKDVCPLLE